MYTELAVINSLRLLDLIQLLKKMVLTFANVDWPNAAKLIRFSGNPEIRGGFTMKNPVF
jgi:hypothetical protein